MKSENHNYMYRGFKIVIKGDEGVAWIKPPARIKHTPTIELKARLEAIVDDYINSNPEIAKIMHKLYPENNGDNDRNPPELGENILRGLEQQSESYKRHIIAELAKWGQPPTPTALLPCVRFGITGIISEGKAGQPNYQIESATDKKTYRYTHEPYDAIAFDEAHITQGLTLADLKIIWHMD
ncbi:MAG: hypothetical protein Q7S87_13215 [Agitococcus sp.]|nr:hypothetical protein [Agitococcus sp.]